MRTSVLLLTAVLLSVCTPNVANNPGSTPPDHKDYDQLLKKYVNDEGMVDYAGLQKDRGSLRAYLAGLEANAPNDDWSEDEKLAYWINAYNAYTLDLIVEYYPVESIRDIGSKIQIPFVNTAWDIKFNGQSHTVTYALKRQLASGESITVSSLGCDEGLHKYMVQLIDQQNKAYGPFETPVATIKGNIINATDIDNIDKFDNVETPENFPLGYFALVEEKNYSIATD